MVVYVAKAKHEMRKVSFSSNLHVDSLSPRIMTFLQGKKTPVMFLTSVILELLMPLTTVRCK